MSHEQYALDGGTELENLSGCTIPPLLVLPPAVLGAVSLLKPIRTGATTDGHSAIPTKVFEAGNFGEDERDGSDDDLFEMDDVTSKPTKGESKAPAGKASETPALALGSSSSDSDSDNDIGPSAAPSGTPKSPAMPIAQAPGTTPPTNISPRGINGHAAAAALPRPTLGSNVPAASSTLLTANLASGGNNTQGAQAGLSEAVKDREVTASEAQFIKAKAEPKPVPIGNPERIHNSLEKKKWGEKLLCSTPTPLSTRRQQTSSHSRG